MRWLINVALSLLVVGGISYGTHSVVGASAERLATGISVEEQEQRDEPAVAQTAEEGYCSTELKTVLRRVLTSCGMIGGGRRGCQPGELKNVAQINDADFNALFSPLAQRGGVILYDVAKEDLDDGAKKLLDKLWAERRGASYFFVVARASTDGDTEKNRALSHRRANSVLFHLQEQFKEPDMERQIGLLWLGEEFAQLGEDFCSWQLSRDLEQCKEEFLNRSAVVSWIDCRL